jgi:hypothetical protein
MVNRRLFVLSGALAALLLPASGAAQPDCSNPRPPAGALQVAGPQIRVGERLIVGPGARVEAAGNDAEGNAVAWTPLVDGREESAWPQAWPAGGHTAAAVAVDACGRRATLAPVAFVVDAEPPAIRWEVNTRQAFMDSNRLAPDDEPKRRKIRFARSGGQPAADSWLSEAGVWQVPLSWVRHGDPTFLDRERYPVRIASEHPQAFLAAPGTVASMDGSDRTLGDRLLWLAADDAGAGVESLTLRLRNDGGRTVLEVEAADHVGNTSKKEIGLRAGGQRGR